MAAYFLSERLNLASMRASAGMARVARGAIAPIRYLLAFGALNPKRLLIAPQDIRTADPTVAEEIYSGYFVFGSKAINTHGRSPFTVPSPTIEWERALMGFGWLRDLRAAGTPLTKANASALVDEWITLCGSPRRSVAWEAGVAARRLLAWLSHSPLVLDGADLRFYRRFMKSIGRHAAFLRQELSGGLKGEARLWAAMALTSVSLCAEGVGGLQKRAVRLLNSEISRQILLDGGHIARNPQTIVELLLDLLPLRQAFVARSVEAPQELISAIDRMLPMLRLFLHGDGSLALFNGMGVTRQDELLTVLAYDDARARPMMNAIASGYQRIEAHGLIVVADMGKPPPPVHSGNAHAGTLSFEMSCEGERIVVNCGAPASARGILRDSARLTGAHTTLSLADAPSSRFAGFEGADRWLAGRIVAGPRHVVAERSENPAGVTIEASHDGYVRRFGLIHERAITVDADGRTIAGRDRLMAANKRPPAGVGADYAIRFHLHPGIRTGRIDDSEGVLLVTPQKRQWVFRCGGKAVAVEESVFFASPDGTRATMQIVVTGQAAPGEAIDWVFERRDT